MSPQRAGVQPVPPDAPQLHQPLRKAVRKEKIPDKDIAKGFDDHDTSDSGTATSSTDRLPAPDRRGLHLPLSEPSSAPSQGSSTPAAPSAPLPTAPEHFHLPDADLLSTEIEVDFDDTTEYYTQFFTSITERMKNNKSLHARTELFTSHKQWQEQFRKDALSEDESVSEMYTELFEELREVIKVCTFSSPG